MKYILKNNYLLSVLSIIVFFATACVAGLAGHNVLVLVAAIEYCAGTFYLLHLRQTNKGRIAVVMIIVGPVIIFLGPVHILSFQSTLVSLPSFIAYFLGVVFGILIFISRLSLKIVLGTVLIGACVFVCIKGYNLWLNKLNFGTYFMATNEALPAALKLTDDSGRPFDIKYSNKNAIVLDFWNTGCGVCFNKFPILQNKQNLFGKMLKVQFYAVNVPINRDTVGQGEAVFKSLKYSIANLNIENLKKADEWGVSSYPTVLVIYKDRVIYRGDIENVDDCLKRLLSAQ